MLLDVGGTLLAIGLAIAGFAVVLLVCVAVLRLLSVVLSGSDADRTGGADGEPTPDPEPGADIGQPEPGDSPRA